MTVDSPLNHQKTAAGYDHIPCRRFESSDTAYAAALEEVLEDSDVLEVVEEVWLTAV